MADLTASLPLGGLDLQIGENRIAEPEGLALVSVAVPPGGEAALAAALNSGLGVALPAPGGSTVAGGTRAIRTAPDQLMLVLPESGQDAEAHVGTALGNAGYVTLQTDAWVMLDLSGPGVQAALERLSMLDTATFPVDASARTVMEHIGVMLVRLGPDRFRLLSASSSARSFLHAVETSFRNTAS